MFDDAAFVVGEAVRLDVFAAAETGFSRSHAAKIIADGLVAVNGKVVAKTGYKLSEGDVVTVTYAEPIPCDVLPEDIPLDILYDDAYVAVVNKPRGMATHIGAGHYSGTLVNALLYRFGGQLSGINGVTRPGIVHRLDKDTTGAIAIAKNDAAHVSLSEQLTRREMSRVYHALCHGSFKETEGVVDAPIGRHPRDRKKMAVIEGGRRAVTRYAVLEQRRKNNATFALVRCKLETGRTHQIRVHMARLGRPIVGDETYGSPKSPFSDIGGQALHASQLTFTHPKTGEQVTVTAPMPPYFTDLLRNIGFSYNFE